MASWIIALTCYSIVFGAFLLWVSVLVQLVRRTDIDPTSKICWVIVYCILGPLGAAIYGLCGPAIPDED